MQIVAKVLRDCWDCRATPLACIEEHFPHINHKDTWKKLEQLNEKAWKLLPALQNFPPQNLKQALSLLSPQVLKGTPLLPMLTSPFTDLLDPEALKDDEFMSLIDEMLLISTQSKAHEVNALIGTLGACYLMDTWVPRGGMTKLGDLILERFQEFGGEFQSRTTVSSIERMDQQDWKVITQREEEYHCQKLISTLPMWNHKSIGPKELEPQIRSWEKNHPKAWGAVTAYLPVRFQKPPETCYFQIHSKELPFSEGHSVFISLSHPEDDSRAPQGEQTLTASIHTHEKHWPHPRKSDDYKKQKAELNEAFQKVINKTFSHYGIEFLSRLEIGTPHTFERYTGRYRGRVGGLPHKRLKTLLSYPSSQTKLANFYRLGDTVFPGQGVVGVISGAQKLIELFKQRGEL
jgi:phytoene dehydrogenase-like protein